MNIIQQWAKKWGIPDVLLDDLRRMSQTVIPVLNSGKTSEASAMQDICFEAPYRQIALWRNNNGAFYDKEGRLIRFGLGNTSGKISKQIKSSDLIGLSQKLITSDMVGKKVAIFTSIEVKKPGWKYSGTKREIAQNNWHDLINGLGGVSYFATGRGDLK